LWGDGVADVTLGQVFFDEGVEFSVFLRGETIDLPLSGGEVRFEINSVIPRSGAGEAGSCLFVEDGQEVVVFLGYLVSEGVRIFL
jgi:hypothetical protein